MGLVKKQIKSFRDLEIWQGGIELVKNIYEVTKFFPSSELYGLTSQMRRAAVSVPSNIAEGHIQKHKNEFKQFLFISLGSLAELETHLTISKELGYFNDHSYDKVIQQVDILGRKIRSLLSKLTPNP